MTEFRFLWCDKCFSYYFVGFLFFFSLLMLITVMRKTLIDTEKKKRKKNPTLGFVITQTISNLKMLVLKK